MTAALHLAVAGLWRRPGRSAIRIAVVMLAVALLAGMILFIGNSLRTASATALRQVPLDLAGARHLLPEGPAGGRRRREAAGRRLCRRSGDRTVRVGERSSRGLSTQTSSGSVLAVPRDYGAHIHTFRMLHGALRPGEIVLDQQMAATLQARIGDTIRLRPRANAPPQSYPVGGVALITAPDQVFQPLNPLLGPAPAQPPQNAAIMLAEHVRADAGASPADDRHRRLGASAQPGAQTGTQWQVQAQLERAPLAAGSPSSALKLATRTVNRLQSVLPGQVQFVDNLSDSLNTAAGDALYAETLFLCWRSRGPDRARRRLSRRARHE